MQELKGNIRVFCRVRPLKAIEAKEEPQSQATIIMAEKCKVHCREGFREVRGGASTVVSGDFAPLRQDASSTTQLLSEWKIRIQHIGLSIPKSPPGPSSGVISVKSIRFL